MPEASDNCLICGAPTELVASSYPGFQAPARFRIVACPGCGVSYSLPRVDASEVYDHIYRSAGSIPGYSRYQQYMEEIGSAPDPLEYLSRSEEAYWGVATALRRAGSLGPGPKCIEIGSGLGYLTFALTRAGCDIRGLDLSEVAVGNARRRFGDHYQSGDVFEFAQANPATFDVVILTEVIEHVDDPPAFLGALRQLLKPGGRIVLTTPNRTFFPPKVVWASTPPPVHCWWFEERTVEWMAGRLGLSTEFLDFSEFYGAGREIDISTPFDYVTLGPILAEDGKLVSGRRLRNLVRRIPFAVALHGRLTHASRPREPLVLGARGTSICAILSDRS